MMRVWFDVARPFSRKRWISSDLDRQELRLTHSLSVGARSYKPWVQVGSSTREGETIEAQLRGAASELVGWIAWGTMGGTLSRCSRSGARSKVDVQTQELWLQKSSLSSSQRRGEPSPSTRREPARAIASVTPSSGPEADWGQASIRHTHPIGLPHVDSVTKITPIAHPQEGERQGRDSTHEWL